MTEESFLITPFYLTYLNTIVAKYNQPYDWFKKMFTEMSLTYTGNIHRIMINGKAYDLFEENADMYLIDIGYNQLRSHLQVAIKFSNQLPVDFIKGMFSKTKCKQNYPIETYYMNCLDGIDQQTSSYDTMHLMLKNNVYPNVSTLIMLCQRTTYLNERVTFIRKVTELTEIYNQLITLEFYNTLFIHCHEIQMMLALLNMYSGNSRINIDYSKFNFASAEKMIVTISQAQPEYFEQGLEVFNMLIKELNSYPSHIIDLTRMTDDSHIQEIPTEQCNPETYSKIERVIKSIIQNNNKYNNVLMMLKIISQLPRINKDYNNTELFIDTISNNLVIDSEDEADNEHEYTNLLIYLVEEVNVLLLDETKIYARHPTIFWIICNKFGLQIVLPNVNKNEGVLQLMVKLLKICQEQETKLLNLSFQQVNMDN